MKAVKPWHSSLFLIALGIVTGILMWFTPEDGIWKIGQSQIKFPNWNSFWEEDTLQTVDMEVIMRASHTSHLHDTVQNLTLEERREQKRIQTLLKARKLQFSPSDTARISRFTKALKSLRPGESIRVLHYGDSQLEGDRISSYLREQWQSAYGGNGPGMLPAVPLTPNFSIETEYSDNWKRFTIYGDRDRRVVHDRYGHMGTMARFTSPVLDEMPHDTVTGWIEYRPSKWAYPEAKEFDKLRVYFGHHRRDLKLSVYTNDTLISTELIPPGGTLLSREYSFDKTPKSVRLVFAGIDSPEVYGISLDGHDGVSVDNVAMRGESGTVFSKLNRANFSRMLNAQPISLVILQYGGNTVPYIRDRDHAAEYAERFRKQIAYFKRLLPGADILVIGPSDMNEKVGTNYVTFKQVPMVRDALKAVAMEEKVGFWDIYGSMGGHNSMADWVQANPPLASPDYIHFTPKGAHQVAEWLFEAFEQEMQNRETNPIP